MNTHNPSIRFVSRQVDDQVTLGDEYEEFLPSGATVLKRITVLFEDGTFHGEILKVLHLYDPAGPGYRRPRETRVRKTVRGYGFTKTKKS